MKDPIDTIEAWEKDTAHSEFSLEKLNMKRHWDPDTYDILKLKNKRILALCKALMAARTAILYAYEDTSDQYYLNKLEEMESILKGEEIPQGKMVCKHGAPTDESCLLCEEE